LSVSPLLLQKINNLVGDFGAKLTQNHPFLLDKEEEKSDND